MSQFAAQLTSTWQNLLASIDGAREVVFLRGRGNIGDHLINAGIRQLLRDRDYREASVCDLGELRGETAIVSGGGSWCAAYSKMAEYLPLVESRFERVIVFPSSYDVRIASVRAVLSASRATVFAREEESYRQIRNLCRAELAHDCAFFFDFKPYQRAGQGVLNAFRTDHDALPMALPADNNDISRTCADLDDWLWTIARNERVRTDRAHVIVAAAMLGKRVEYRSTRYHKVPGIVQHSLQGFPVEPLADEVLSEPTSPAVGAVHAPTTCRKLDPAATVGWWEDVARTNRDIADVAEPTSILIIADEDQLEFSLGQRRCFRFPERGGDYWGPPVDDDTALLEFRRLLALEPDYFVIAWPAFWWIDAYPEFCAYLRREFDCVLKNERLIMFRLRPPHRQCRDTSPARAGSVR